MSLDVVSHELESHVGHGDYLKKEASIRKISSINYLTIRVEYFANRSVLKELGTYLKYSFY